MEHIQNKKVFYSLITMIIASISMIFNDTLFYQGYEIQYFTGRLLILTGFFFIFYKNIKNKTLNENEQYLLWLITMMYAIHGQFFRPGYFLAYIQALFFASLCFEFDSKKFAITLFLCFCGLYVASKQCIGIHLYTHANLIQDTIFGAFLCSILGGFVYFFATQQEMEYHKMHILFYEAGKNSSSLLHDIKGQIQSPILYNEMMKFQLDAGNINVINDLINRQANDLAVISKYINEFNKITITGKNLKNKSKININELIDNATSIARLASSNVKIEFSNDNSLDDKPINEIVLLKTIYNLMKNSTEAMAQQNIQNKKIFIDVKSSNLIIKDNGNGFSSDLIVNLNKNRFSKIKSNKKDGGLGLFLMKDTLNTQGIKTKFYNDNGAAIKLYFS